MRKYLLMAGEIYYPGGGTDDWIGTFKTWQEAKDQVRETPDGLYAYKVNKKPCDWYQIVFLDEWTN